MASPGIPEKNPSGRSPAARGWVDDLARAGAQLEIELPGGECLRTGHAESIARVHVRSGSAMRAIEQGDHLGIAEAYLRGGIDVDGSLLEVMKVTDQLAMEQGALTRARFALRLLLSERTRYDRDSIAFHYDRPAEFFLPWLGRSRCYSHGLYTSSDDSIEDAMERKFARAFDALGLEPGMDVLDMGGGWGCFIEYAGIRGVHVHAITISQVQYDFVRELIRDRELACTIEFVNFREYQPTRRFDAAVFMGTFEHNPEYHRAARFLARYLTPDGRVWADFCAQRSDFAFGRFMKKYIWPGPIRYVSPHALCGALIEAGFNIYELTDDTLSYACTVRDWGDGLEANAEPLAKEFGEETIRAFLLFLRGSQYFLETNRTQAYHVVAGRAPRPLA